MHATNFDLLIVSILVFQKNIFLFYRLRVRFRIDFLQIGRNRFVPTLGKVALCRELKIYGKFKRLEPENICCGIRVRKAHYIYRALVLFLTKFLYLLYNFSLQKVSSPSRSLRLLSLLICGKCNNPIWKFVTSVRSR